MSTHADRIEKRYYSISEVADQLNVNPSLIRFWESEFDILKPAKNKKGERRFTNKDIEDLQVVYHLVKEKGFTLEGAKEHLKHEAHNTRERIQIIKSLKNLRKLLVALRDSLNSH